MAKETNIPYCDATCNPTLGCSGCELWTKSCKACYAGTLHEQDGGLRKGYSPTFEQITFQSRDMAAAAKRPDLYGSRRPKKPWLDGLSKVIFLGDLGDTLCDDVPFPYLRMEIVENVVTRAGRRHQWLLPTKRPDRLKEFWEWLQEQSYPWPTNLWAGTSISTMKATSRIEDLLKVGDKSTLRFVAVEPQWEQIDLQPWLPKLDWIIQGGETGDARRKRFDVAWIDQMREHCREAGVPLFITQLGRRPFDGKKQLRLKDRDGGGLVRMAGPASCSRDADRGCRGGE